MQDSDTLWNKSFWLIFKLNELASVLCIDMVLQKKSTNVDF